METLPGEIVTPRLLLRLWKPTDVPALRVAIEASIEHLRPWLVWVPLEPLSDEDRIRLVASGNEDWENGGDANYGVFLGAAVVGGCGLHRRQGLDNTLDIGYWIHSDHIGNGYAKELARGLVTAAFSVAGINFVEIHHDKANIGSGGVPQALGFDRGPEQPDEVRAPGEVGIDCVWTMSRSDWIARPRQPKSS